MGPNQAVRIGWVVCCFARAMPAGPVEYIVAGLGNPGKEYEGSRHNAGFMGMEALADRLHVKIDRVKFKSYCGQADIGGRRTLLLMPQTFMNLSGEAVREACSFIKSRRSARSFCSTTFPCRWAPCGCAARGATAGSGG